MADNLFAGKLTTQLLNFSRNQLREEYATLNIANNQLSGPLPDAFKHMLTDAHGVDSIQSSGNHFSCAGHTTDWPDWVRRLGSSHAFGLCAPLQHGANSSPPTCVTDGRTDGRTSARLQASAPKLCNSSQGGMLVSLGWQ